jgi:hypothetical protein
LGERLVRNEEVRGSIPLSSTTVPLPPSPATPNARAGADRTMPSLAEAVAPWHDVYILIGTASATLIGLMFVAASVGTGVYSKDRYHALRAFLSPTVVHFACALAACMFAIAPLRSWPLFGLLIGATGLYGIGYAVMVWRNMLRHGLTVSIDLEDRICYAAIPAVGYATMLAACVELVREDAMGCDLLAIAMGLLLMIGIRNAWDMTIFTVMRRGQGSPTAEPYADTVHDADREEHRPGDQ